MVKSLLCLYDTIRAASSKSFLLSFFTEERIISVIFNSITEYASGPIPVSANKLLMSFNLTFTPFR